MPNPEADLLAEALVWLEWTHGAGGRLLPADAAAEVRWTEVISQEEVAAATPRVGERTEGPSSAQAPSARPTALVRSRRRPRATGLDVEERVRRLACLQEDVAGCTRCALAATRRQTVFGQGSPTPKLVIVGEAPGADEDRTGEPFVGRAGGLLTKMLGAIGLSREDVFICNVLKCRPPDNRSPRPDEVAACRPFLREQLELLEPPLILALGSPAVRELLRTERGITSLRGRFARTPDGYKVMPSYHPAYLLRRPEAKRDAWHDLKKVAAELGLTVPPR